MGESIHIIILDTLVAVIAGIIIFPACFTYDVEVTVIWMGTVFDNLFGTAQWAFATEIGYSLFGNNHILWGILLSEIRKQYLCTVPGKDYNPDKYAQFLSEEDLHRPDNGIRFHLLQSPRHIPDADNPE